MWKEASGSCLHMFAYDATAAALTPIPLQGRDSSNYRHRWPLSELFRKTLSSFYPSQICSIRIPGYRSQAFLTLSDGSDVCSYLKTTAPTFSTCLPHWNELYKARNWPEARDLVFCCELRRYSIHVSGIDTESRDYCYDFASPPTYGQHDCFSPLQPEGLYLMNTQAIKPRKSQLRY